MTPKERLERKAELLQELMELKKQIEQQSSIDPNTLSDVERKEAIFSLPELTPDHMSLLRSSGFITGSTVFNDPAKADDIDYCIKGSPRVFSGYAIGISDKANDEYMWSKTDFVSIKGHCKGKVINILCFSDPELYEAWSLATDAMIDLLSSPKWDVKIYEACAVKWKRVRIFRALVDALRTDYVSKQEKWGDSYPDNKRDDLTVKECIGFRICRR